MTTPRRNPLVVIDELIAEAKKREAYIAQLIDMIDYELGEHAEDQGYCNCHFCDTGRDLGIVERKEEK